MSVLLPSQAQLGLSFGGVEVLLVMTMVWFLYWQSTRMKGLARRIITLDTSAANYTVMVGRTPERLPCNPMHPPCSPTPPSLHPHASSLQPHVDQVGRMPESTREGEALSAFFGQWGDVVHCAVVLNYRELILASRHRAACREALHHRQVE